MSRPSQRRRSREGLAQGDDAVPTVAQEEPGVSPGPLGPGKSRRGARGSGEETERVGSGAEELQRRANASPAPSPKCEEWREAEKAESAQGARRLTWRVTFKEPP